MMGYDELERCLGKAATAYAGACAKHPVFPSRASYHPEWKRVINLEYLRNRVNRRDEGRDCSIHSVQEEELLEAVNEAANGNWDAAIEETYHLIATALRAVEYYESQRVKR